MFVACYPRGTVTLLGDRAKTAPQHTHLREVEVATHYGELVACGGCCLERGRHCTEGDDAPHAEQTADRANDVMMRFFHIPASYVRSVWTFMYTRASMVLFAYIIRNE